MARRLLLLSLNETRARLNRQNATAPVEPTQVRRDSQNQGADHETVLPAGGAGWRFDMAGNFFDGEGRSFRGTGLSRIRAPVRLRLRLARLWTALLRLPTTRGSGSRHRWAALQRGDRHGVSVSGVSRLRCGLCDSGLLR